MYTCDWFMLMYGRNQHNIVKQLPSNKNFFKNAMEYCWAITFISLNNWSTHTYICGKWLWLCISPIMEKIVINKPMHVSLQMCPTLCDPMDCSTPNSFVHGILQARILEWIAMLSSRGSFQPRDQTHNFYVSCIERCVTISTLKHQRHILNISIKEWTNEQSGNSSPHKS